MNRITEETPEGVVLRAAVVAAIRNEASNFYRHNHDKRLTLDDFFQSGYAAVWKYRAALDALDSDERAMRCVTLSCKWAFLKAIRYKSGKLRDAFYRAYEVENIERIESRDDESGKYEEQEANRRKLLSYCQGKLTDPVYKTAARRLLKALDGASYVDIAQEERVCAEAARASVGRLVAKARREIGADYRRGF